MSLQESADLISKLNSGENDTGRYLREVARDQIFV